MEEQQLSELCKNHDPIAQRSLYELYAGLMIGVCMRYVSRRDIAEDLLHDGFIKIFNSFDKFSWRGKGSLRAWMSRIMANIAVEYLRKEKRNLIISSDADGGASLINNSGIEDPDVNTTAKVPQSVLVDFISKLPSGYRTVFNLFVIEEYSHKEIAEMLNINEKSSSSQLLRAKTALAKMVNQYIKDNDL